MAQYFQILKDICERATDKPHVMFKAIILYSISKIDYENCNDDLLELLFDLESVGSFNEKKQDLINEAWDKFITYSLKTLDRKPLDELEIKKIFSKLFLLSDYNNHVCDEISKALNSLGVTTKIFISTEEKEIEGYTIVYRFQTQGIAAYQYSIQNTTTNEVRINVDDLNGLFKNMREKVKTMSKIFLYGFLYICPISPKCIFLTHHLALLGISRSEEYKKNKNNVFSTCGDDFSAEFEYEPKSKGAVVVSELKIYRGNLKDLYDAMRDSGYDF